MKNTLCAFAGSLMAATSASAQVALVQSATDLGPDYGVLDLATPPTCNFGVESLSIPVTSGRSVVITTTRGVDGGSPWFAGCFNYSQSLVSFHVPNNQTTDPGDKRGHFQSPGSAADVILDFSEPLVGFGFSTMFQTVFSSSRNERETLTVYDGPTATGNVLGTVQIQGTLVQKVWVEFVGFTGAAPQIRSARLTGAGDEFYIDAYVVAVGAAPTCGTADFDGDGDAGTDADIEAFFACLGGACCPTCGTADFDGDGDSGTDADIEAFFRVLGGGSC